MAPRSHGDLAPPLGLATGTRHGDLAHQRVLLALRGLLALRVLLALHGDLAPSLLPLGRGSEWGTDGHKVAADEIGGDSSCGTTYYTVPNKYHIVPK
eukprot:16433659-Heterocapsa_arctica.AAC.1